MPQRPNLTVIHVDQLRYDCVGAFGRREGICTPHIDSIVWQGANFSSCYAACPVYIPQWLSLLTGQTPEHYGLFSDIGIPYLPLEHILPMEMWRGGHETALVGRTMHTYPASCSYGFEYYPPGDPSSERKDSGDAFFKYLKDYNPEDRGGYYGNGPYNNSRVAGPFHLVDHFHQTKWATNQAIDFLDSRDASRPFLLFVDYYAPYSPHNSPAEYFNRYYNRTDLDEPRIAPWDVPPVNNGNAMFRHTYFQGEEFRAVRAGYYGNTASLDSQTSRLLERAIRLDNTYVIFTSDYGEILGDYYLYQKSRPYEGVVHIPSMTMDSDTPDCQEIHNPVGWHDIMPTILDLAGLSILDTVDGKSMIPLLRGETNTQWRSFLHGECFHEPMLSAGQKPIPQQLNLVYERGSYFLTDGIMRYVWYDVNGAEQLFQISTDYQELQDLSRPSIYQDELTRWRFLLMRELAGRPEGFSDGTSPTPGEDPVRANREMLRLVRQQAEEGFSLAFSRKKPPESFMNFENHFFN